MAELAANAEPQQPKAKAKGKIRPPLGPKIAVELVTEKRILWLNELNSGAAAITRSHNALYCWLRRNDGDWLAKNIPPRKQKPTSWSRQEDTMLAEEIWHAARQIAEKYPRARLSQRQIAKLTSKPNLVVHDKIRLPKTQQALNATIENVETWAKRRILIAAALLYNRPRMVRWRLLAKAGISKQLASRGPISRFIDTICYI